jgi:hypothetical protein
MVLLHLLLFFGCLCLEVEFFQLVKFCPHGLALVPLLQPHLVVLPSVSQQVLLDLASVLQLELVVAEFEIDKGVVLLEAVTELLADLGGQLVVGYIKHQKRGVIADSFNELHDARRVWRVLRTQLVRFQV